MSKKRPNKDEQMQDVQTKLAEARAKRLARHNAAEKPQATEKNDEKEAFQAFWSRERNKFQKDKEFGDLVWIHLKAAGFDKSELFEKGCEHFGLKTKQSLK